jgi:hypothetical protein
VDAYEWLAGSDGRKKDFCEPISMSNLTSLQMIKLLRFVLLAIGGFAFVFDLWATSISADEHAVTQTKQPDAKAMGPGGKR